MPDVKARSKTSCHPKRLNSDGGLTHLPPVLHQRLQLEPRTTKPRRCAQLGTACAAMLPKEPRFGLKRRLTSVTLTVCFFFLIPPQSFTGSQRKGEEIQKRTPGPLYWGGWWMRAANGLQTKSKLLGKVTASAAGWRRQQRTQSCAFSPRTERQRCQTCLFISPEKLLPFALNPMCGQTSDPGCGSPVAERLLKPFPSALVPSEGERGSHPELSTMNGARDGLECRVRGA